MGGPRRRSRRGYSPDGRHIWNGEQWIPLRGGSFAGRRRGSRAGGSVTSAVAVGVLLVCALGWAVSDGRHHEGEVAQMRQSAHCASFNLGDPCR